MKQLIHFLVIHDGEKNNNPLSYLLANELARLGRIELCHLLDPPEKVADNTFVLVDDPHVVRWRRQLPNYDDLPAWMREVKTVYKIGREVMASQEALIENGLAVMKDAQSHLLEALVAVSAKPQSAISIPVATDSARLERRN